MKPLLQVEGLVRDYRLPRRNLLGPVPRRRALFGEAVPEVQFGEFVGAAGVRDGALPDRALAGDGQDQEEDPRLR